MFDSPVEAVRCAIVIQQSMVGRNLELPDEQWIRFRIGVNLGDVIVEPDDIYGEGVNVAARLEQLAEPGNIYISGGVYEQIRYKLVCGYQSLGDRKVKNILDPVPIYRVLPDPAALAKAARGGRIRLGLLGAGTIIAVGIGAGGWYHLGTPNRAVRRRLPPRAQAPAPCRRFRRHSGRCTGPARRTAAASDFGAGPADCRPLRRARPPPDRYRPHPLRFPPTPRKCRLPPSRRGCRPRSPTHRTAIAEPEMVPVAGGTFRMGSNEDPSEQPIHAVTVGSFLMAKYPVTVRQWRECVKGEGLWLRPER